jgi:flagellar hook assembly protein FlgD
LPKSSPVQIKIVNLNGQEIFIQVDGDRPGGQHAEVWNGTDASGDKVAPRIYIYIPLLLATNHLPERLFVSIG